MSMRDYEMNTAMLFNTGFDDRECNRQMFEEMKGKIVNDISRAFQKDKTLSEYITSNLDFKFTGYKIRVDYTFVCHDENEAEAESFSNYYLQSVRHGLQEQRYTMENLICKASDMDMGWPDRAVSDAANGWRAIRFTRWDFTEEVVWAAPWQGRIGGRNFVCFLPAGRRIYGHLGRCWM